MRKMVYINKNENGGIAICKDGFNGVAIQVIRFVDQLKPTGTDGELTQHKTNVVIKQILVKHTTQNFKESVEKSILEAKDFMKVIALQDKDIDGVMNDYYSQNKPLNESEEIDE